MIGGPVVVAAAAKVNLYLHVVARRTDGYHDLDSLIVFAGVADRITVSAAAQFSLAVAGPFAAAVPAGDDNLVLRAARSLAAAAGVAAGAAITLTKELPVAAGIGGGSADAAAVLRALTDLWRVSLPPAMLADLALTLGADVPMCLAGRPAFVGGIGERLEPPPPLPPAWLVLANPRVALSTPAVFRERREPFSDPGRFAGAPADAAALAALLDSRHNDLTAAAMRLAPVVGACLEALSALPGCRLARMSGSGPTCFGLFATEAEARPAATALAAAEPGWWVVPAPILRVPAPIETG